MLVFDIVRIKRDPQHVTILRQIADRPFALRPVQIEAKVADQRGHGLGGAASSSSITEPGASMPAGCPSTRPPARANASRSGRKALGTSIKSRSSARARTRDRKSVV